MKELDLLLLSFSMESGQIFIVLIPIKKLCGIVLKLPVNF